MSLFLFGIITFVSVVAADPVKYENCGNSKYAIVNGVDVSSCNMTQSCKAERVSSPKFTIYFTPKNAVDKVKVSLGASKWKVGIPVPQSVNGLKIYEPDGCNDSGLNCPLPAEEKQVYKADFQILKEYPKLSLTVKYQLLDEDNHVLVCIKVPIEITD